MNMVCYEGGLLWTGLLGTGLLWTWSVMNVVCYERVCYEQVCNEHGLFWVVCCEWSVLKGNRISQATLDLKNSFHSMGEIYNKRHNSLIVVRQWLQS